MLMKFIREGGIKHSILENVATNLDLKFAMLSLSQYFGINAS
jgi:hypothetical protein